MKKGKKNIKLRVKNLIEKYNEKNPYKLCQKLGINVVFDDLKEIKGYYKNVLGNKYIVINDELDDYSKKIVLCHELGHAVLHSSKNINFMKKNFTYYASELENEANEFAAQLLLQQYEVIRKEVAENCDLGMTILEDIKRFLK